MAIFQLEKFKSFCKDHLRRRTAKKSKDRRSASSQLDNAFHETSSRDLPQSKTQLPATDSSSQCRARTEPDLGDAQPLAYLAQLATIARHELNDTEKAHPSRSTSGSESLYHENDRPRSVFSVPSEPFPTLHEEPSSMSESSQLYTPLLSEHRHSDTSARKQHYGTDDERDRVIPKEILCYLKVMFDGKKLGRRMAFQLDWLNDASYETVNNAAEKCLNASPETIKKKVWRTAGVCKLFKKDQEWASKAMEDKDQWSEVLHLIVAEFVTIPGNEYAKFHLEITWNYAAVDDTATEKHYSKKIADLIDDRMRINWSRKKFIPQIDFHAIMSQSVIEHLIHEDESLQGSQNASIWGGQTFDKKQFIRDVASKHKKLLALCVYEDLPLICLWQMLYLGEQPATFPLSSSDMPSAAEKIKFDNILVKQWWFTPYQFPNPTNANVHCFDLKDDEILPIEDCGEVEPIGSGASKLVYKVKIQPGHHRFTADKNSAFALMVFKNGCPLEDFERESKVLRKLIDVPHKNIAPHFASWTQTRQFFMLSPLASCNLKGYWKTTQPRLSDSDFVLWELRQLRGLADAVKYIYNLGGYHHDLKGHNILVYDEGDCSGPTLKISDFGSAKILARRPGPKDESNPTNSYSQGTSSYEAPDYVILGETSRPYDVWTLGCIFLDMLVWTFGAIPSEVEKFSNERRRAKGGKLSCDTMFWYIDFKDGYCTTHWKPIVRKRLQGLEDLCSSDKGRAVFKELVLTTSKMLRMNPSVRPKPFEVHNDMERMTLWAEEAVREPDWKIQDLLIGSVPSTTKSETSGESDGDGVPVIARYGHLMMTNTEIFEANALLAARKPRPKSLYERRDFDFMGWNENTRLSENAPSSFHLVVDDVDRRSDDNPSRLETMTERPLYGSHLISPDRDAFGEARTAVPSAAASEFHLPPTLPLSMSFNGTEEKAAGIHQDARRRSSIS